jgi:hypothetical protein
VPFYLGSPVPLTFPLTDANGNLADPASTQPVCTVTLPDQTTSAPSVTHSGTGTFTATGPSSQAGHYTVAWSCADTAYPGGFTDAYDIRALAETSLLSLAEAKRALRIDPDNTDEDDFVTEFSRATTGIVEWWCGPVNQQAVTERLPAGGLVIQLSKPPVISLTAWTVIPAALATAGIAIPNPPSPMFPARVFGVSYPLSQLYADPVLGVVTHTSGLPFYYGEYLWSYQAGRPIVPDCIQSGFKAILKHIYGMERGGQGSAALGAGESETTLTPMGYAVPNRALELMAAERPAAGASFA